MEVFQNERTHKLNDKFIPMKFGFRIPSINKRIAARTSWKRIVRHNHGLKVPRGYGWITNPKKYMYNKVYNKTSRGCLVQLLILFGIAYFFIEIIIGGVLH